MSTLTQAFNQWCNRPADQRFASLADLAAAVRHWRERAKSSHGVDLAKVRAIGNEQGLALQGPSGRIVDMTHHAFGQLCRIVQAPAAYLRALPAKLAAENLQHGLDRLDVLDLEDTEMAHNATMLLDAPEGEVPTVRQFCSNRYGRIWNADVVNRLERLVIQHPEWQPAPPAFDGSRGLYASEEDMFAFMVDNERRIFESLPGGGLGRGFFVSNSEVGAGSFTVTTFLYEYVCGNHRVWGAKGVREIRIPHLGNADERAFRSLAIELRAYADSSAADDELKIAAARRYVLGAGKDEVLDAVFGLRINGLSRKLIGAAYDRAEIREDRYGPPNTAWALAGGITELSQDKSNATERVALDRAAGKLMEVAF